MNIHNNSDNNNDNSKYLEEVEEYFKEQDRVQKKYRDQVYDAESEDRVEKNHFKRKDRKRKYKWNQEF